MRAITRRIIQEQQTLLIPPAVSPSLHYLKLLQIWQWENSQTIDTALDQAQANGYTGLLVKALDGPYWMGQIDSSPEALGSVADVQAHTAKARARGMYYFCWTNPRQFELAQQTSLTAWCADASDGVFLDIEPYSQFWGPWAPIGLAALFMEQLRDLTESFIALQPDPRVNALASLRIGEWTPRADAISGQHYWSDFNSDPVEELVHAEALGNLYGIPSLPTLPGNAPYDSFPKAEISDQPGFVVWRLGSTPTRTLSMLGSLPVAGFASTRLQART